MRLTELHKLHICVLKRPLKINDENISLDQIEPRT